MDIEGKNALVLGGAGLVGTAVCRELLALDPARLVVASRQKVRAERAVELLSDEHPGTSTRLVAVWGDIFVRAEWQREDTHSRAAALADAETRWRLIADILDPLDEDMITTSLLSQIIEGRAAGLEGRPSEVIVDCINTATAVSYQNIFAAARRLAERVRDQPPKAEWAVEVETLLASLYIPQLVRHVQLLYEAMRRAGTEAYLKVGTSGTGGMGFNIPYTHGEERPSRLVLSKAALAGAQSLLTFLMARTPGGPRVVKEIKPAAVIGWREIGYGPILRGGREIPIYDCSPDQAVSIHDKASLAAEGDFGSRTDDRLQGVYVDTGENGQFAASEFITITALGQMQLVTPEEIARNVARELLGGNTGRDVVAALDGAIMGPSYRGGYLRQAAIERLRQLEAEHGDSIAFEILGPPRLSKLLFEASLLKRAYRTGSAVLRETGEALGAAAQRQVFEDRDLRCRIISIGIPILLSDGERLLRGPVVKAEDAHHGWVDLTAENMIRWQARLKAMGESTGREFVRDSSSRGPLCLTGGRDWGSEGGSLDVGEIVAWIFRCEDLGLRGKD